MALLKRTQRLGHRYSSGPALRGSLLVGMVILAMAGPVLAESTSTRVFRCDLPTGVVAFSDRYCGEGSRVVHLNAPPQQGISFAAEGDFAAVAQDNADRAQARRVSRLRKQQGDLRESHRTTLSVLRERLAALPNNAFKVSRARQLEQQIEQEQASYANRQRELVESFQERAATAQR